MSRNQDYEAGASFATKRAIEFIHQRANEMNDEKAKAVLNSAAFSMGVKHRAALKDNAHAG